jgi:ATP-dependent Clp protease ATP-binding subunit ClpA
MNHRINLDDVRGQVEKSIVLGKGSEGARLPQTPRAKKVIEFAIEEARSLNHHLVGTEHLILGLVREKEGVAGRVLVSMGLGLENVREEVLNLVGWPGAEGKVQSEPINYADLHPTPTNPAVLQLDGLIELLVDIKINAIDHKDFDFAAQIRDETEKLHKLREFLVRQQHRLPTDGTGPNDQKTQSQG